MKQEDKDLLLRYLSMALPYRVVIKYKGTFGEAPEPMTLFELNRVMANHYYEVEFCKPHLRPMSSMTDDDEKEYNILCNYNNNEQKAIILLNWLLEKRFDFMGLIPKGLAIEVTENNNPYKD